MSYLSHLGVFHGAAGSSLLARRIICFDQTPKYNARFKQVIPSSSVIIMAPPKHPPSPIASSSGLRRDIEVRSANEPVLAQLADLRSIAARLDGSMERIQQEIRSELVPLATQLRLGLEAVEQRVRAEHGAMGNYLQAIAAIRQTPLSTGAVGDVQDIEMTAPLPSVDVSAAVVASLQLPVTEDELDGGSSEGDDGLFVSQTSTRNNRKRKRSPSPSSTDIASLGRSILSRGSDDVQSKTAPSHAPTPPASRHGSETRVIASSPRQVKDVEMSNSCQSSNAEYIQPPRSPEVFEPRADLQSHFKDLHQRHQVPTEYGGMRTNYHPGFNIAGAQNAPSTLLRSPSSKLETAESKQGDALQAPLATSIAPSTQNARPPARRDSALTEGKRDESSRSNSQPIFSRPHPLPKRVQAEGKSGEAAKIASGSLPQREPSEIAPTSPIVPLPRKPGPTRRSEYMSLAKAKLAKVDQDKGSQPRGQPLGTKTPSPAATVKPSTRPSEQPAIVKASQPPSTNPPQHRVNRPAATARMQPTVQLDSSKTGVKAGSGPETPRRRSTQSETVASGSPKPRDAQSQAPSPGNILPSPRDPRLVRRKGSAMSTGGSCNDQSEAQPSSAAQVNPAPSSSTTAKTSMKPRKKSVTFEIDTQPSSTIPPQRHPSHPTTASSVQPAGSSAEGKREEGSTHTRPSVVSPAASAETGARQPEQRPRKRISMTEWAERRKQAKD